MRVPVLTVKQLNSYVKSLIEGDVRLASVYIKGEISNFKSHYQSGHLYFSLKDSEAVIRAVMFRSAASYLKFIPEDGMNVICRGRVSIYERDGAYQLYVDEMIPEGIGELTVAFEQIKERLAQKGYFDEIYKKPIVKFPQNIAVITSDTGAAVQDILNIINRRYPICEITLCPVHVQGEHAVPDMIDAIRRVSELGTVDTIIIGRGGGSIEDLWAFNSEELATEIFMCAIPIISAVGHETDFTICDFVADLRAPTPSAAAELAVPDIRDLKMRIDSITNRLALLASAKIKEYETVFKTLTVNSVLSTPEKYLDIKASTLSGVYSKLLTAYDKKVIFSENRFKEIIGKLNALSPLAVLKRGYCVVSKGNKIFSNAADLTIGDTVDVKMAHGSAVCEILTVTEE